MYKRYIITSLLFIAVLFGSRIAGYAQSKDTYDSMAADILRIINEHRKGKALMPLTNDVIIAEAAEQHSRNMATKKIPFGHDGFDGRMARIRKQIKNTYGWAENVAYGAEDANEAVDMWLHSDGHRQNIEGDYNRSGIGIVKGKDCQLYFTQIFVHAGN